MRKLSHQELRELQLSILDDVNSFCIKNNIRYTLSGGSLLGAVRHKGFIPWDDDIDIMMPRPDYERFLREYKSENGFYFIDSHEYNPDYISAFAKVIDIRTKTKGTNIIDDRNVFIDVCPVDGMPPEADLMEYINEIQSILNNLRKAGKYYKYAEGIVQKTVFLAKYVIKTINLPSKSSMFERLDKILKKYPFGSTPFAGGAVGKYAKKEWVPLSVFQNYKPMLFEGRQIMCISDYDTYLKSLYGDYMKLPPENQRVAEHFYEVYFDEKQ